MGRITIPVEVTPDISLIREVGLSLGANKPEYQSMVFILSHGMVMVTDCDVEGNIKSYHTPKYYGCRLTNGRIEVLDVRYGWRVDQEATKKYAEEKAEEELLK
jgi:hypothetical protein